MRKTPRGIFTCIMALAFCLALSGGANAAPTEYCRDLDGDLYGDPADCETAYETGLVADAGDCNDLDKLINPGATDICGDLIDNNCSDEIDEGCPGAPTGNINYCRDSDLDGYGSPTDCVNDPEPGFIANDGDCDDTIVTINPGEMELCGDGIDNNCLNGIDEGCSGGNKQYYYRDADSDGFGDPAVWEYVANPSTGYIITAGDCDDTPGSGFYINPGKAEICSTTDLTDENCSDAANEGCQSWWEDGDNDGYSTGNNLYDMSAPTGYVLEASLASITAIDCQDGSAGINPGMAEICSTTDLTDENCSTTANEGCLNWWQDGDNDGYSTGFNIYDMSAPTGYVLEASLASTTAIDCQDGSASINPAMAEICSTTDLTDENCLGGANDGCQSWWQDGDNDGYSTGNNLYDMSAPAEYVLEASLASTTAFDCQDGLAVINPGMAEVCNTSDLTDENCSGTANEGCRNWWQDDDYDHYSTGSILYSISAPAGYVLETTLASTSVLDCNDLNWSVNPGRAELGGDLIDQNCDGDPGPIFSDPKLEACVLSHTYGNYSEEAITNLVSLTCNYGITNLTGMEYLTGLSYLNLGNNFNYGGFSDLTPLANLTGLTYLSIFNNRTIKDITPLANLTSLTTLNILNTSVTNLTPLTDLTDLIHLWLPNYNRLDDLTPLANLTSLVGLELYGNSVSDSDLTNLANLTALRSLDLSFNQISDLSPLANLTNLTTLKIKYNQISDLTPLADLTNLNYLVLDHNYINDLTPLADLTALMRLEFRSNSVSDLAPLASLTNLTTVWAQDNSVSDLSPLASLANLHVLAFVNSSISDLSPLANLTGLTKLYLDYNLISDLTPLANLKDLQTLQITYNSITDVTPLANLDNLFYLYLAGNCITDFTPVADVPSLSGQTLQCQ